MIVKMKFLSITGPKADIDRVVEQYLSKYEIHLENALSELKTVQNLTPYIQINPYKEKLKLAEDYTGLLPEDARKTGKPMTLESAINCIQETDRVLAKLKAERTELEAKRNRLRELSVKIEPFQDLPCSLSSLLDFRFIKFRFGKIPKDYYTKFKNYIYENSESVFYQCHSDSQYIWGIYFCPKDQISKIDAVYASMHFERIYLPNEYEGTPEEAYHRLITEKEQAEADIRSCDDKMADYLSSHAEELIGSRNKLEDMSENFDVRKLAACTKSKAETFYILCGWMAAKDAEAFQREISSDPNLYCFIEDNDNNILSQPPTKLKNPKFFRPFEMFVKMYGLPGYNEFDPTIYLAITYSFIFGIMFGDVGQGLCFVIGGFLIYHFKKAPLPAIMGTAGIFSVIWGFVYNSFFGFEGFFPYEALIHAKDDMTTLPGLGSLNTVFVLAIAFGMFMILINIILGIINAVKQNDKENIWFSQNAVAGLVFYGAIVVLIFMVMNGYGGLNTLLPVLLVLIVAGLIGIFLKEMLGRMASGKKPAIEGGKGMFFVQAFFETFETVLSFLSNTLSYVRIGAYAVSHVAMMQVVMMLAGAENGGSANIVVVIAGNAFVAAMEGLMVAIQVLRLEYYEMFSRFYKGNGREFKPFLKKELKENH